MFNFKKKTKDVLERLKSEEATPKPKKEVFSNQKQAKPEIEKVSNPVGSFSIYQVKIEKSINKLNDIERKMKKGENYFTYYYEYNKACTEFNDILKDFEKFETSFVPTTLKKKIDDTKIKVSAHMNRKMPESKLNKKLNNNNPDDFIDL